MPDLHSKFLGCILGHAVGDAFGAPFEGLTSDLIYAQFGRVSDIVAKPPKELTTLYYSDDTQMTLGLIDHLLEFGEVRPTDLMKTFATNYDPKRGYGQGARRLFESFLFHEDWENYARTMFPGGSYGNGAAMRVAPIGLLYFEDETRVWEQARLSAQITHTHPLGIEGAQLLALAVALLVKTEKFDRPAFFEKLHSRATLDEYQWLLRTASHLTEKDSLSLLGSSLEAHRSVVTAIACFSIFPENYQRALGRALALGDDTDTVMAMTGALSGAYLGRDAVPQHLLQMMEDGEKGRTAIEKLAEALFQKYQNPPPGGSTPIA